MTRCCHSLPGAANALPDGELLAIDSVRTAGAECRELEVFSPWMKMTVGRYSAETT
jgi:hypothetical protein